MNEQDREEADRSGVDRGGAGLLGSTTEAVVRSLSSGVTAASAVLATVFLAGGVVQEDRAFLLFAAVLAVACALAFVAPHALAIPRWRRWRIVLTTLGLGGVAVVGARGVQSLWGSIGRRSLPNDAPSVLLVTVGGATALGSTRADGRGWLSFPDVFAASPRRDASLATLLSGEEPIEHRVLLDGDAPRSGMRTVAERLRDEGYDTARFGAKLPEWADAGYGSVRPQTNLTVVLSWLRQGAGRPRFAHLHLEEASVDALVARIETLPDTGAEVIVATLGGERPAGRPAEPEGPSPLPDDDPRLRVALWWGSLALPTVLRARPRGLVSIVPTLLERVGLASTLEEGATADGPSLFHLDRPGTALVVSMEHLKDGVHRIRARTKDTELHVGATPLGTHPFDDWVLDGQSQAHFVYRNDVEIRGASPSEFMLLLLSEWRQRNGRFESSPR